MYRGHGQHQVNLILSLYRETTGQRKVFLPDTIYDLEPKVLASNLVLFQNILEYHFRWQKIRKENVFICL